MNTDKCEPISENPVDALLKTQQYFECELNKLVDEIATEEAYRFSKIKSRNDSRTEHVQIVMYRHTNGSGRLFGGALLQMIDVVGAICARRHAGTEVTTVAIDHLEFKAPAQINSTLVLISEVESVGRTSMKVKISTFVEQLNGSREEINTAHATFVALDRQNRPTPVPRLLEAQ
ncbi:MAG: acyl-CoA thioesterase [Clostridiaceae bacterium]|mgnify:FL=1|nr:acyl-CoA thioesterase [Clostridiaceae bacterium]